MLYWIFLYVSIALIVGLNMLFNFSMATFGWLFLSFAVVLLPSLFIAILIRKLPKRWFDYNNKIYQVKDSERNFYKKIQVHKWKDKIPEAGQTANFKKDHIYNPDSMEYIEKFLLETCYGSVLHLGCIISALLFSFLGLLWHGFFTMTFPIAIVYSILNVLSFIIQRYNRPRLVKKLERMKRIKTSKE